MHTGLGRAMLIGLLGALLFCACTKSRGPSSSAATSVHLKASITLTGTIAGQQSFEVTRNTTGGCSGLVSKPTGAAAQRPFDIPLPTTVGARSTFWSVALSPYVGPGAYGKNFFTSLQVTIGGEANASDSFMRDDKTKAATTIGSDGSGSFTFSGLADKTKRLEAGSVTWSCSAS